MIRFRSAISTDGAISQRLLDFADHLENVGMPGAKAAGLIAELAGHYVVGDEDEFLEWCRAFQWARGRAGGGTAGTGGRP
jgi:hypothetical protein